MRLPSDRLPAAYRSAVRFVIVGTTGMFLQDGIYRLSLWGLTALFDEVGWVIAAAFTIGFVIEMVINYFVSAWYTFGSKPNIANAGGFLFARGLNLICQFVFLHLLIRLGMQAENAGFPSIFMAGIINYFVLRIFFRKRKIDDTNERRRFRKRNAYK